MRANRLLGPLVVLVGACIGQRPAPPRVPSAAPADRAARGATPPPGRSGTGPAVPSPVPEHGHPLPCTEHHGNVLVCAGVAIEGLTVTVAGDGSFHRVAWRRQFGSEKRWRNIALYDTGLISFIVNPGVGNARGWWTLSRWAFPRTRPLTVTRLPGALRFEVTDATGAVWTLAGAAAARGHMSFTVESIAGRRQAALDLARSDRGIVGLDLQGIHPLLLEQSVPSYSPYANVKTPAYLGRRSRFRDRKGATCAVRNRELFGDRNDGAQRPSRFLFDTDAELLGFLQSRCPALDLAPLRDPRSPAPG